MTVQKSSERKKPAKQSKTAGARRGRKVGKLPRKSEAPTSFIQPDTSRSSLPELPVYEMREARAVDARESDAELFDAARHHWLTGEWDALAGWHVAEFANHPKRARIALLIAATLQELEDHDGSKEALRQAVAWGAQRRDLVNVVIGQAHAALGRARMATKEFDQAEKHFLACITSIAPNRSAQHYAKNRVFREAVDLGLLPEAQKLLKQDLAALGRGPHANSPELAIFATRVELLGHELTLAIQRAQVGALAMPPSSSATPARLGHQPATQLEDIGKRASSQLGQDLWVLEKTGFKRGGFFVDFGATDGVLLSNTYLLETEFGWTGLCAEPNPQFVSHLRRNRSCKVTNECISGASGEEVEFLFADEYGGITKHLDDVHGERRRGFRESGKVRKLRSISLHDFLVQHDAPRTIDYLSIDTEGSEYEILRAFPFKEWNVRLITVEHNFTPMRQQLRELLTAHGYSCREERWDDWYELKSPSQLP
jgi:FkbM family methyltransferase